MAITKENLIEEAERHEAEAEALQVAIAKHVHAAKVLRDAAAVFDPAEKPARGRGGRPAKPRPAERANLTTGVKAASSPAADRPTCALCPRKIHADGAPCPDCQRRVCGKCKVVSRGARRCTECVGKTAVSPAVASQSLKDKIKADFAKKRAAAAPKPQKPATSGDFKSCENCHHRLADGGNCPGCAKEICAQCRRALGGCKECKEAGALS